MSNNSNLHKAKKAKNDEFYTQLSDIENELGHYKDHFKNKVVYCNCDDPRWSNFVKYFQINFYKLGLKKLIATGYKKNGRGVKLVYDSDHKDANVEELQDNGDFRSQECVKLLDEADIVVSNPPFSLASLYMQQLIAHGKKFLIIGNMNALKYKEIFPLIKANKIWIGYNFNKTMEFQLDESYEKWNEIRDGKKYGKVPAIAWFTNLDHKKRHEKLILTEKYDPAKYQKYDNFNCIRIKRTCDIPSDYDGFMGVPITFLGVYNPNQFEILDGLNRYTIFDYFKVNEHVRAKHSHCTNVNGKATFFAILIRRKPVGEKAETPAA